MRERVEGKETLPPNYLASDRAVVIDEWQKLGDAGKLSLSRLLMAEHVRIVEEYVESAYKTNDGLIQD